jgi:hypothetical protein
MTTEHSKGLYWQPLTGEQKIRITAMIPAVSLNHVVEDLLLTPEPKEIVNTRARSLVEAGDIFFNNSSLQQGFEDDEIIGISPFVLESSKATSSRVGRRIITKTFSLFVARTHDTRRTDYRESMPAIVTIANQRLESLDIVHFPPYPRYDSSQ